MENNKLTLTKTSKALSTQFEPQSPQIRDWIKIELGKLAIMFGQPMTKERLTLYAEELQSFKQYQLQIAFNRLKRERKSSDFGFPLPGDIIELTKPQVAETENPDIKEWKGPTEEEIRQRYEQQPEMASWWKQLKQQIALIGLRKRDEKKSKPEVLQRTSELTDAELDARRALLKQQAAEVAKRMKQA